MMKRSDFAQKLLDDLRVRKEQLSISQKGLSTDNYAYSNRGFKGSKETRAKTITFQDFNYEGTKSLTSGIEASNQILPYGKSRNMEKIDLSKALAYALENAGKATRGDPSGNASIISFLHEVGKRSLGYGTEERRSMVQQQQQPSSSNQQLPMIHVHIKEISKGTQKLNQIIKACSNGLGFRKGSRYSIQCGEDLMEGAIELEQSLRLLVDIQQASEYTTNKQRSRNRIKLLEENDEEEEEDTSNRKYTKIKEVAKADIEMRTQRNSTSLDLVIPKEITQTANGVHHKAKSQNKDTCGKDRAKDGSNIKKRKEKKREVHKVEILEKKHQDISNPNGKFCKVMKPQENQKPNPKEAETCINSTLEVSEVEVKSSKKNELEHKRQIKDDSILLIAAERVPCQASPENNHEMDQQAPLSNSDGISDKLSKTSYKGTKEEVKEDIPLLEKRLEHRKSETTKTLSKNEINLKKIVLKSQLFLDTAEALFKLNIPRNILHGLDGNNYNQEDKNLILDCGYELMKRKGRFQELSVHPFVKAPISSSKVNSLDQLVRQLSKEFEKLRAYGKDCYNGSYVEDYTPKVLVRDVYHKDPNLNSMWDMGWNDAMFAFIEKDDVVRDIEREVFSGLMEEITKDLICI
ncbi:hypothetical protein AALP_AA6G163100 [Arabis alpina]|uniref:DUF3741 domain-containing protein n=1 Tax=Arabis alpina TaxID=50452 RepID=A0A087GPM1_ARAAL|nr:hypothetical protein AALP_AA6G163100 [Arabis alpina]